MIDQANRIVTLTEFEADTTRRLLDGTSCRELGCRVRLLDFPDFTVWHIGPDSVIQKKQFAETEWGNVDADDIRAWLRSLHAPAPVEQACACGCC